jgi:hypothetical protein
MILLTSAAESSFVERKLIGIFTEKQKIKIELSTLAMKHLCLDPLGSSIISDLFRM